MGWADNPGHPLGSKLYYICLAGLVVPARDLIDREADINVQGGKYGNALQAAAYRGHQEVVQLLLDMGAGTNIQGSKYGNALQAASLAGHQEVMRLLLGKGADTNVQGGKYGNALQAASLGGHQEIAQLLLHKEQVIMTIATHDPERGERRQPSRQTGDD
ncbi:ankyrin repeat-containing domain protein [Aspergillus nidulans var. acristatus]